MVFLAILIVYGVIQFGDGGRALQRDQWFFNWTRWVNNLAIGNAEINLSLMVLGPVLVLLLMPVSALFAGLFLEEVAGAVEARHYPEDTTGRDQPFVQGLWIALKFTGLLILLNILALPLYFIPIVNVVTYWGLNGYLLGREYFELVALRHRTPDDARTLRRQKKASVFFTGVGAAALASIPLVNLLTPFFATAMMVHLHKRFSEGPRSQKLG